MAEAKEYPKFSFRIAPEVAAKLEEEATNRELTTSELVREIVTSTMKRVRRLVGTESVASEADAQRRFQQLIFEIGKTRAAVLRIGLQTIPEETMEQILAAATQDAKNYAEVVAASFDGLTAKPGEQGDASDS